MRNSSPAQGRKTMNLINEEQPPAARGFAIQVKQLKNLKCFYSTTECPRLTSNSVKLDTECIMVAHHHKEINVSQLTHFRSTV